jgi:serine/threonine-protein kinase
LVVGINVVVLAREGSAQSAADSATAQALFDDARSLMQKGDYAEACPKLEESQRLDPGSGTLLNLADCYEHRGRIASAWTMFLESAAAARTAGNSDRERISRERAALLEKRLGRIIVLVAATHTAGLEVRRDGSVVRAAQRGTAIPVDAGQHTISATASGRKDWQTTVVVRDGSTETVQVPELAPLDSSSSAKSSARPPPPTMSGSGDSTSGIGAVGESADARSGGLGSQRVVALVAGVVGVAGVAAGTFFGLRAMALHDDSQKPEFCSGPACVHQDGVDLQERSRQAGDFSTIAFAVGAAGLAAGTILWFTAPAGTKVGAGAGMVHVRGAW